MDVSIIIVNYNTKELTAQCMDSIRQQTCGLEYEVIIADNNSTDGSNSYFKKRKDCVFVSAKKNLGFGKANNLGLKIAKGRYIFFLNSDTILLNNAIKIFYDYFENTNDKLGAIGCYLQGYDNKPCHSYAKLASAYRVICSYAIAPFSRKFSKKIMGTDLMDDEEKGNVGYVTGADLFISRTVLEECGAFDPDFFMYSEEAEMQYRFVNHGYVNRIIKGPQIIHLEGMSSGPNKKQKKPSMKKILMIQESLFLYVKKTSNIFAYALFCILFPIIRIPFLMMGQYSFKEKKVYAKLLLTHHYSL